MAGVGFELKKQLIVDDSILNKTNTVTVSAIVTVAPMLLTVIIMLTVQQYMVWRGTMYESREKFMLIIYYVFASSFIVSSLISQPLTRYVSDRIYEQKFDRILPSFYGGVSIYFIICIPFSIIFLYFSELSLDLNLLGISLKFLIGIVFLQMLFLSSIREYKFIISGFFLAFCVTIISVILFNMLGVEVITASLLGVQIGFVILSVFFMRCIRRNFPSTGIRYFDFLTTLADYPQSLFIGLLLSLGAFLHCVILWTMPGTVVVGGFLRYSPDYDVTTFVAYLTLIPMYIRFTIFAEVHFAEKHQIFYALITKKGRYKNIKAAHQEMKTVLWREIGKLAEVHLIVALSAISILLVIVPDAIISPSNVSLFRVLVLGYFAYGLMQCIIIMLLYFDDRKGAMFIALTFNILTAISTISLLPLGSSFFGIGFFVSGIISLIISLVRLNNYMKYLEYFTFCLQPMYVKQRGSLARYIYRMADLLNSLCRTRDNKALGSEQH